MHNIFQCHKKVSALSEKSFAFMVCHLVYAQSAHLKQEASVFVFFVTDIILCLNLKYCNLIKTKIYLLGQNVADTSRPEQHLGQTARASQISGKIWHSETLPSECITAHWHVFKSHHFFHLHVNVLKKFVCFCRICRRTWE